MAQTHVASHSSDDHRRTTAGKIWPLALGSIGVAYGDIGTSPLYAFKEATGHAMAHGLTGSAAVLGVLSLILWSLALVVTLKYVIFQIGRAHV